MFVYLFVELWKSPALLPGPYVSPVEALQWNAIVGWVWGVVVVVAAGLCSSLSAVKH